MRAVLTAFLIFTTQNAFSRDRVVPDEWILTRESRSQSWEKIHSGLRDLFEMKQVFGPAKQFALVKLRPHRSGVVLPKLRGVRAQPNFIYSSEADFDPEFDRSWGLANTGQSIKDLPPGTDHIAPGKSRADIAAPDAWNIFSGTKDSVVGIIDSGIDRTHPELRNNMWVNPGEIAGNGIDDDGNGYIDDIHGWNFVTNSPDINDDRGHGTFVAGVIGAEHGNGLGSRGVNKRVSMMAIKSMDSLGLGTTESAVRAIQYAVANGARVLNMSWGGTSYDPALYDVVRWAGQQGVLCVIAAGNAYKNNDTDPEPYYPASFRLPNIISVAAYDNQDKKADFSNFGPESVHIGAPGSGIYSTAPGGGYKMGAGTSYATPHVAGVASLLLGYIPSLSLGVLRERILATSDVIGYYERLRTQTAGRVSAWNALRDVRPNRPRTPTNWMRKITSISTPHPYANYSGDTYRVEVPGATHVRVHFSQFNTEECCDHLVIRDSTGTEVWRYAGKVGAATTVDVLGSSMELQFQSDYSTTEYGFDIDYVEANFDP